METPNHIKEILKRLPGKPGVYQYYDDQDTLLYVGKAKHLKKRVSSYFSKKRFESAKTKVLVKQVHDIKWIVVESEYDALLLENNLIKSFQPKYNIQLKDDKTFPFIAIKNERFPRVISTRTREKDGTEYFGPYASVKTMNALLELIRSVFPLRTCNYALTEENIAKEKFSVCLEYHLGNCLGPCEGKMAEAEYNLNINHIRALLKGKVGEIIQFLKLEMNTHAELLEFEKAARVKTFIGRLQRFQTKSTVVHTTISDVDVFSIISDAKGAYVNYMRVIDGAIVQGHTEEFRKRMDETDEEILEFSIINIRSKTGSNSKHLYLPFEVSLNIPDIKVHVPQRGDKKALIDLSKKNAFYFMKDKQKQQELTNPSAHRDRVLENMKVDLRLKTLPVHIECFDNSNIQGTNPASACVVFKDGKPSKNDYRKFDIKTVVGPNDFASMEEVVQRRYKRLMDEGASLPQLVIIDGGKGQLSSALSAIDRLGLRGKMTVIGIAKRLEEIYFPGDQFPVYLDKRSTTLKLIQQLRNEAHRFSLAHHRTKRSKSFIKSELDDIPGVGDVTKGKLIKVFKSVGNIKKQDLESLENEVGKAMASRVFGYFHKK